MSRYKLRAVAWPLGLDMVISEENDPLSCLRDQAGPTLPGLAQSLTLPSLLPPWPTSPPFPTLPSDQLPPSPQELSHTTIHSVSQESKLRLRKASVYGYRRFQREAGSFRLSQTPLNLPSEFSSNPIPSSKKPLSYPHVFRHLRSPPPQCSEVIRTANVSETSFSPKRHKIQSPFSGTH